MMLVPIVALVDADLLPKLVEAAVKLAEESPAAVDAMHPAMNKNGWTTEMLIAGSMITTAIEDLMAEGSL